MFHSDKMRGSYFIVQKSKFLLIDATAVTLGQGHREIIQYILPDLYIICSKYLRCSWNGFDMREKSRCGSGRGGGNKLKTESHPRPRWLNYPRIIYMHITYLAHTQKIEEIVTLSTLMKPIFIWSRLASEIFMAVRGWKNHDLVVRGTHSPGSIK